MDKKTKKLNCTSFSNTKKHDLRLFKGSRVRWIKIAVELPTVDIQVYKNYKATQNYQRNLPQKAINGRGKATESRNFLRES